MPTRYARISVVRDAALDEALREARGKLQAGSEAARLRELALIGARALRGDDGERVLVREYLRERYGARLADGDVLLAARAARRLVADKDHEPETASESLEWARGDR